ncbi:MAG: DUF4365 domain-containing protein [Solirubrobacterales bacterium]
MTQRPKEHVLGEQALNEVAAAIARAGHAVERVANDYGEDLLVQTSHAGRMDASRLWLQVKGTETIDRYRLKRGGFSLSVDLDHALRWSRSADLVAIVLWDVPAKYGWYARADHQPDPRRSLTLGRKTRVLPFSEDDEFTPEAVNHLAWESRIDHYRALLLKARNADEDGQFEDPPREGRSERRILIALDFLMLLDLIGRRNRDGEEEFFLLDETLKRLATAIAEDELHEGARIAVQAAGIKVLLRRSAEIGEGMGLPTVLLEECVEALLVLTNAFGDLSWLEEILP